MTWHLAGLIALNLSMVLYSLMYWPQLCHNRNRHHLKQMSFAFHTILFGSVSLDLYYAIGYIGQWQYLVVDLSFWLFLLIQHTQRLRITQNPSIRLQHHILLFFVLIITLGSLSHMHHPWSRHFSDTMGWVANLGYWSCGLPQVIKNQINQQADAISPWYLLIGITASFLDGFCAWALHWGSATRYGFIMPIVIKTVLYYQSLIFQPTTDTEPCIETG